MKRIQRVVGSVVSHDTAAAQKDFDHLLSRAEDLVVRKRSMQGTKSETRDLLSEIVFTRLRRAFRALQQSGDLKDEIRTAEWVVGALVAGGTLDEFAAALDAVMLKTARHEDYSFAGRADFISIEEVLQMLGAGKHAGCLSLEKRDNRLDVFVHRGHVAFLDPHQLVRRVFPGSSPMDYREVTPDAIRAAEDRRGSDGTPLVLGLLESGVFGAVDHRALMRQLGTETLFDFLRGQGDTNFHYRKMEVLPEYAQTSDLRLGVTPLLLEVSKRLDDWRTMEAAFPDPKAPIQPYDDMLAKISSLNLGVIEIKMLTMITGEHSPEDLVRMSGLPISEIYQLLVTLAKAGAVMPHSEAALDDAQMSVEESMQAAFEMLDANDDQLAVSSALDKVLGGDEEDADGGKLTLDFLGD